MRQMITRFSTGLILLCAVGLSCKRTENENPKLLARRTQLELDYITYALAFSSDGRLLATGSGMASSLGSRGEVKLWETGTFKCTRTLVGVKGEIESLAFTPDGTGIAAAGSKLIHWDVASGKERYSLEGVRSFAFSPNGQWLATIHGVDTPLSRFFPFKIQLWDQRTGTPLRLIETRTDPPALCFSPDSATLAVGGRGSAVRFWDVATWTERGAFPSEINAEFMQYTPDGTKLFLDSPTTGCDASVKACYYIEDGRRAYVFLDAPYLIWDAAFSLDGRLFAAGGDDLRLFDAESGKLLHRWQPPPRNDGFDSTSANDVCSIAFSTDGKTLACAAWDRKVIIWDVLPEPGSMPTRR